MLEVGSVFAGKYRIVRAIGAGGMGAVFEVENTANGQRFALKTVHPHLMQSAAALDRFKVEVRASVMVASGHVVKAIDTGVDEATKTPWLLLEMLAGHTLEHEIRTRGPMSVPAARAMLEQLGDALRAAHTARPQAVVHLDLKPSNIFLAQTGMVGVGSVVKVLDFGIARFIEAGKTAADLTSKSGTQEWMAPEQFELGVVRPAADVWAFALVAFYALTGKFFWLSANVPSEQYRAAAVLAEVLGKPIPRASVRAAALGVTTSLPQGFDDWFARCVEREEAQRFASAVDAVPALLAALPTASTSTPPVPAPQREAARGETAVGAPSVPRDVPPPMRETERVRGGTEWAPSPVVPPRRAPEPVAAVVSPKRAPRWWLALGALPVVLGAWFALRVGDTAKGPDATVVAADAGLRVRDAGVTRAVAVDAGPRCPEGMVLIPAGRMTLGSPEGVGGSDEHPAYEAVADAFCLDRTEVTVAAYRACVSAGTCNANVSTVDWSGISSSDRRTYSRTCNYGLNDREQHPVNCLNWADAERFCTVWRQARLPSEAEWEYAARRPDGRRVYPWGDQAPSRTLLNACGRECQQWASRNRLSWSAMHQDDDGWPNTAPVGNFPSGQSADGLQDLAGNVWEWVADPYNATAYAARTRGFNARVVESSQNSGENASRVIRGGCWDSGDPSGVRAANRNGFAPSARLNFVGVRCARGVLW